MIENNKCKILVICGSNLGSTVNFIYYNRFLRNILNIPINLNSIILGIILSDGHLFKNKANNTLFSFKQTIDRFDYFWSVFNNFSQFCKGYPLLHFCILIWIKIRTNWNFPPVAFAKWKANGAHLLPCCPHRSSKGAAHKQGRSATCALGLALAYSTPRFAFESCVR